MTKAVDTVSQSVARRPGRKPGPLSSISLLSLLAACAGGGGGGGDAAGGAPPPAAALGGQVVKGYVEGAAVFLDRDGDGLPDPGDEPVFTDAEGRYTLEAAAGTDGTIVAVGGVDTLTNVPLDGTIFKAPAGATVVTPLTTLVVEIAASEGVSVGEASSRVLDAFGLTLPDGTDLIDFDPLADMDGAGAAVEDVSEIVLNTVLSIQSILEGAQVDGAAEKALAAATAAIRNGTPTDWSDVGTVEALLDRVFDDNGLGASDAADLTALAQAIAAMNGTLEERSGLDEAARLATRYALSDFQDLMKQVGAGAETNATDPENQFLDISFNDQDVKDGVEEVVDDPKTAIDASGDTAISFELRQEDDPFTLALRPALKFVDGEPADVESITLNFLQAGVVAERVTVSSGGETRETLAPNGGVYSIDFDDLDKIQITPPQDFNGTLQVEIGLSYRGIADEAPQTFDIDIAAVNDAPAIAAGQETQVFAGSSDGVFAPGGAPVETLFGPALDDSRDAVASTGGSGADGLAGIAVVADAAPEGQGAWQYSTDGGAQWRDLPAVSDGAAFVLAADALIRFHPAESFRIGNPGALTVRLIDDSAGGAASGAVIDLSAAGAVGGETAYSADTVSVTASFDIAFIDPPTVPEGIADGINAAEAAAGVPVTIGLATSTAIAGDRIEVLLDGASLSPPVIGEITADHIAAGEIVLTIPPGSLGADGAKDLAVKLTYPADGGEALSEPISIVLDTQAPGQPVLDQVDATIPGEEAEAFVITGTATGSSSVEVTVAGAGGDPIVLILGTDPVGRFHAQVNLAAVASPVNGAVLLTAVGLDAAGNPSAAVTLDLAVGEENPATTHTGTPTGVAVEGSEARDVFTPDDATNESFFLGGDGYDSLSFGDLASSAVRLSLVPESNRDTLEAILQAVGASQDFDQSIWRVSALDGSTEVFVQAEEVALADAIVRLTAEGAIADDGGAVLSGGFGSEYLVGGSGDDRLFGGDGADRLIGNEGDDVLVSQGGDDFLNGGAGDDVLVAFGNAGAGESAVTLQGGAGQDDFVVSPSEGFAREVTIADFFVGEDLIDLSAFRVDDGGIRALTADDIDLDALSAAMETQGFFEIDFSIAQFVTAEGDAIDGGLRVERAELGGSGLSSDDFVFAAAESALAQDPSIEAHAALVIGG